LNTM